MYKPDGRGHFFSPKEAESLLDGVADLVDQVAVGTTGDRQNALVQVLHAIQPAFSEGEMRAAIRKFLGREGKPMFEEEPGE